MNKDRIEYDYCSICGYKHNCHGDDFGYLDCMLYYRQHLEPIEIKEQRESKVEVWDIQKKIWVPKIEYNKRYERE